MTKFLLGVIVGFYVSSIGVEASIQKLNGAVDTVQGWASDASKS